MSFLFFFGGGSITFSDALGSSVDFLSTSGSGSFLLRGCFPLLGMSGQPSDAAIQNSKKQNETSGRSEDDLNSLFISTYFDKP